MSESDNDDLVALAEERAKTLKSNERLLVDPDTRSMQAITVKHETGAGGLAAVAPQTHPLALLTAAIEKGCGIETLERLVALYERMEARNAERAYADAKSRFQARLPAIVKAKHVDARGWKRDEDGARKGAQFDFTPLGGIATAIAPYLEECGLSYSWRYAEDRETGWARVTCTVLHREGHREEVSFSGPPDTSGQKNAIQQRASTLTYLERYTLIGALGLATVDADDDGASAGPVQASAPAQKTHQRPRSRSGGASAGESAAATPPNGNGGEERPGASADGDKLCSDGQRRLLLAKAKAAGVPIERVCAALAVTGVENIRMRDVNEALDYIAKEGGA